MIWDWLDEIEDVVEFLYNIVEIDEFFGIVLLLLFVGWIFFFWVILFEFFDNFLGVGVDCW